MLNSDSSYLSSRCIEKLLRLLKIDDYTVLQEPHIVKVKTREDLMKILVNLAPFEDNDEYPRLMDQLDDKCQAHIGSWNFETVSSEEAVRGR